MFWWVVRWLISSLRPDAPVSVEPLFPLEVVMGVLINLDDRHVDVLMRCFLGMWHEPGLRFVRLTEICSLAQPPSSWSK